MKESKIGKFIADVRKEKGLTQEDIARRLGITSQSVSKWERGVNEPDISVLKELSAILGVEVEELLRGSRKEEYLKKKITKKNRKEDSKNSKRRVLVLGIFIILLAGLAVGTLILKKINDESGVRYTKEFVLIKKNDVMVNEGLSYFQFRKHLNPDLVEKLFDKNSGMVTKDDLSDDEKMFLTLSNYSFNHGGCIYYAFDYYFKDTDLEKLIFENYSFMNQYKKEGEHYLVQNIIDLVYERGIYNATGNPGGELDEPNYVFDIIETKRNKDKLVIDFRLGYVFARYSEEDKDYRYYSYVNINDSDYFEEFDSEGKYDDNLKSFRGDLREEFHSYRYTLKIVGEQVYFESIEKI